MTFRILVTGSRDWSDFIAVRDALLQYMSGPSTVLVHGDCPDGADAMADTAWDDFRTYGFAPLLAPAERYPGKDFPSFKARNQYMVDLGADVCLAFATSWASGTGQTARMARRAGIPVIDYGVDTA